MIARSRLVIVDDLVNRDEAFTKLARGALDVAIIFERDFEPCHVPDGIDTLALFDDPTRVLLPAQHPLASRRTVRLSALGNEIWVRPHDGPAARHMDYVLGHGRISPPMLTAGHGEEPIEAQALVAAGRGITIAYDLNVIINPDQVVVRQLSGCQSVRHIQAAYISDQPNPAAASAIEALRHVGQQHR